MLSQIDPQSEFVNGFRPSSLMNSEDSSASGLLSGVIYMFVGAKCATAHYGFPGQFTPEYLSPNR